MKHVSSAILIASLALVACEFHARGPEDYKVAVRQVLETRNDQIQTCYNQALTSSKGLSGSLTVSFVVQPDTGVISKPEVASQSTAPPALGQCVVNALDGLALSPADAREGHGTFTWEFGQAT